MHESHVSFRQPLPPNRAIAAAIRLLADDQLKVVEAARDCLRQYGERARAQLNKAAELAEASVRVRARELLRNLEVRRLLRRLLALDLDHAGRKKPEALLTGTVLSAQMVRTFTITAPQLSCILRGEAKVLRRKIRGRSLPVSARILSEHLAGTMGLSGGESSKGELDHVLLDRVLVNRVGIPVALSLIWLLVARWAGLSVSGVGMPEHFLLRLHGRRPVLLDPFHGGRQVTKVDCIRHLKSIGYGQVLSHLRDLTEREVLTHYLRALRSAAESKGRGDTHETLRDALFRLETL